MFAQRCPESPATGFVRSIRWPALAACSLMLFLLLAAPVAAAPAPPVQVYYIPVPEDQALQTIRDIFPGSASAGCAVQPGQDLPAEPVTSYVSISVLTGGTILYYDQWEDGYEVDLTQPAQDSTQVWGDGDPANGIAPGVLTDTFAANTVVVLRADVVSTTRLEVEDDFDGGDRIGATRTVAVTRGMWAAGSGTRHAGALEVYPVTKWGTHYRAPVGVNTPATDLFEYTSLAVMAAMSGTVEIDGDADGSFEISAPLAQGQSYLSPGTIREGAVVSASVPVQVALITGDICSLYESRWFVPFPVDDWSNAYYSPVSTGPSTEDGDRGTMVYLYNPHTTPLTVTRQISTGVVTTLVVPIGATTASTMPYGTGAAFAAVDGRPFAAVAAVDTTLDDHEAFDWGIDLIPENRLTTQTLIGWGAGRDPDSSANPNENGSPVWVMAVPAVGSTEPIRICVDYNGDNLGTGPNAGQDANGFAYDELLTLPPLANARVYDPDGDQTGMLLYVCDPDPAQPSGARLAAAWGEDPAVASHAAPGLDIGTTAPPAASFEAGKSADLIVDLDGDGLADGGDTLRYAVIVRNASRVALPNVVVSDTVPLYTSYVLSSTSVITGSSAVTVSDSLTGTPFPLDDGGIDLGPMPIGGVFTVTFAVQLDDLLPEEVDRVRNVAVVTVGDEVDEPEVETPVDRDPGIELTKAASPVVVFAGRTVTYTFTVSNTGSEALHAVTLVDNRCSPSFTGGDLDADQILDLDELWSYGCSAVISETVVNTATVTALGEAGEPVTDTASALVTVTSGKVYLPILYNARPEVPCPPPDGCPLAESIKGLAVDSTRNRLYVVTRSPNQLLRVDPHLMEIEASANLGPEPWGIVVNEQTNRVYVGHYATGAPTSEVWIFDGDALSTTAPIKVPVGMEPALMEILPVLDSVFVLQHRDSHVAVLQGTTLAQDVDSGGSGPFGIAVDSVNRRVFISHRNSSSMTMLRQEGGTWRSFPGPQFGDRREPFELAYAADSQMLYLIYSRQVEGTTRWYLQIWQPQDNRDWGQFNPIEIRNGGDGGAGLEVNPATGHIFTVNTGDDSLSVFRSTPDGALAELRTELLGDDPFALALNPKTGTVFVGMRGTGNLVKIVDQP